MNKGSIEIVRGDITDLDCDAIVNAANSSLMGGGGVDGAIHRKAGPELLKECSAIGGCPTGEARITRGYNLKARYVIHAVGPIWQNGLHKEDQMLKQAYANSMKLASEHRLNSIAFPNISTGIFRFPKKTAAHIALKTVKEEVVKNGISKVIFVCFDEENYQIYKELLGQQ
jgi:O-acetyl-ADP-ribose deacetylase (regulator of RNase III)